MKRTRTVTNMDLDVSDAAGRFIFKAVHGWFDPEWWPVAGLIADLPRDDLLDCLSLALSQQNDETNQDEVQEIHDAILDAEDVNGDVTIWLKE